MFPKPAVRPIPPIPAPSAEHDCTFSTEWSSNATHHWHACTGENCNEKKDKGEHDYEAGSCTVCGKSQSSAVRYQSVCNNIAASIAAFTPPATAALAATGGSEPVFTPAIAGQYMTVKGMATFIKLLGDMMVNPQFNPVDNAVAMTASYTAPNGLYSETFSACVLYSFDEENNRITMTWDVEQSSGNNENDIFFYMDISYDFATDTLLGFDLQSSQPGIAFWFKYAEGALSVWFPHDSAGINTMLTQYLAPHMQNVDTKRGQLSTAFDYTAEYTVAMNTMNPQFAA